MLESGNVSISDAKEAVHASTITSATSESAQRNQNPKQYKDTGRADKPLEIQRTRHIALQFSYDFNSNLGFLGGPYTPMVTVELNLSDFQFVSPLAALANAAGATSSTISSTAGYSNFSVSLPAEDLALGESG